MFAAKVRDKELDHPFLLTFYAIIVAAKWLCFSNTNLHSLIPKWFYFSNTNLHSLIPSPILIWDPDSTFETMRLVMWKPEHENRIKRNFHTKASHRLPNMFGIARKTCKKPRWLGDGMWNYLLAHWNTKYYH
ncbi:hypothetical protein JHK87_052406 [Glycine soja]|nr:hypothetical protein JHK87_052406 [Glycine soja]